MISYVRSANTVLRISNRLRERRSDMLEKGIKAPEFSLEDQNGKRHSLSDYAGKRVLLYFYPKDNTSGCTKQAVGYSALKKDFEDRGVTVLGVSKDSVSSHKRFEEKQGLSITLLSDPDMKTITAYDVLKEKKLYGKTSVGVVRTTYLIDEDGMIVFSSDKVSAATDAATMIEKLG